ncbi:Vacuolar-sorting protein SNF7 [Apophysomyces sp. BC1021]|nr:Vacuolar-sorting protein SNF7 [Apophysomyces sp. BC1021]
MAEVEQTTTSLLQSSLPPSVPPTLSSYAYEVDRSTAPTTEHGDNSSATAIRSPSNPPSVVHSPLPSLQTYHESSLEDDEEDKIPTDKVHLTMLLVSGNRYTFEFDPSTTIAQVKQYVHDQWPQEWSDRSQPSLDSLEVVYLGKFLENETTLESNRLRGGHTTTVHLIVRQFSNKAEENLFQLKFTAKQLNKQSKRCQKDEATEKLKLKKAMQDGNIEGARIYAANAIRKKNESLNLLRLSSRIDGAVSRIQTAIVMRKVSSSMANVVKGIDRAMESTNLEKISMVMDKFESQLEDLDVQASTVEGAMAGSATNLMPESEVDVLMKQVADEHSLELNQQLLELEPSKVLIKPVAEDREDQDTILTRRLQALRN